jgi:hypothetical protein
MAGRKGSKLHNLKRLAFRWALQQRFSLAALEVKVPQLGARVDVAACRPERPRKLRGRTVFKPGAIAVFECKSTRADFLKDARCEDFIREQLRILQLKRLELEESLRRNFPTLREGETLFPEYDMYRYLDAGCAPYAELVAEMNALTAQLHGRSKFARLMRWNAANVLYVVAEQEVAFPQELPSGWGLLERRGEELFMVVRAVWQDVPELHRWNLMVRIGQSASAFLDESLEERGRGKS